MKRRALRELVVHAPLVFGGLVTLMPLLWMLSASFMSPGDANALPPRFIPRPFTLENYVELLTRLELARNFLNSTIVAGGATVLSVGIASLAGYAFAKLRFRGRDGLFRAVTLALVIPAQVGMLPLFLMLREIGLVNTYVGVMIPFLASALGIFMIRQYVLGIPDDLLHAARVDGAGELRIFWSIVLPVIRPILVTFATFIFLSAWNDFMWPLIVLSDSGNYTLPVALANLVGEHVQDTELMMAGSVLTILPALIVFLALQRAYVRGVLSGSIRG